MDSAQQKTIERFENLKRDLFPHIEALDSSYSECNHCNRKTFTNRKESILRVNLRRMVEQIDRDIASLRNGEHNNEE